jgi:hypothetical protein
MALFTAAFVVTVLALDRAAGAEAEFFTIFVGVLLTFWVTTFDEHAQTAWPCGEF